jgi:hypothetical protein
MQLFFFLLHGPNFAMHGPRNSQEILWLITAVGNGIAQHFCRHGVEPIRVAGMTCTEVAIGHVELSVFVQVNGVPFRKERHIFRHFPAILASEKDLAVTGVASG